MAGFLVAATVAIASQVATQPRPGPAPPTPTRPPAKPGTSPAAITESTIRGAVRALPTGIRLRRARVTLESIPPAIRRTAFTDMNGTYSFARIEPGRYRVVADRFGYVSMEFGQRRVNEPGKPLEIGARDSLEGVDLALPRTNAITGRVLDQYGEPVYLATVQAMKIRSVAGRRRLIPFARIERTNDIGEFRLWGLVPGDYYVAATPPPSSPTIDPDDPTYGTTFYPGTLIPPDAQRIQVSQGLDALNVEFALFPVRRARVSGYVIDSAGRSARNATISLSQVFSAPGWAATVPAWSQTGGAFSFPNVPAGEYELSVTYAPPGAQAPEFASQRILAQGDDYGGIVLMTAKGSTLRGNMSLEGRRVIGVRLDPAPRVFTVPGAPGVSEQGGGGAGATVDFQGFSLPGLFGPRLLRVADLPAGMMLKAILRVGQDVTDEPIVFRGADVVSVDVVLTDRPTHVSGTVFTNNSAVVNDCVVIVFPPDRARWGYQSRFVQAVRTDQRGRFVLQGLPAADYLLMAMLDMGDREIDDDDFLESLRARAVAFRIGDGETKEIPLTLPAPR